MSKSHIIGRTSEEPTFAQLKEFFAQIESGRITRTRLQEFLSGREPAFRTIVDYSQTVEDLVRIGRYDWANENITSRNFPSGETGKALIDIHLLKSDSSEDATRQMKEQGLRPATLKELLALGAAYPDLQQVHPIVALGSTWNLGGKLFAPCLRGDSLYPYRDVRLFWVEGWTLDGFFAAVHNK